MDLIRGIDADETKKIVVDGVLAIARKLGVTPICEGVETAGEFKTLRDMGVDLMQGYYFARPEIGALPVGGEVEDGWRMAAAG